MSVVRITTSYICCCHVLTRKIIDIDIGVDLFKLGIISNKFGAYQNAIHTGIRTVGASWTRGLIQQLFAISRDLWGYRCSILHAKNKETLDKLYQNELWEMHQDLRSDWWRFGPKDLQIIGDGEVVFSEGITRVVDMWQQ